MSHEVVYGYPCVTNPNDFTPDTECCSPDEIAAHKAACESWGKPSYKPNDGCYTKVAEDGTVMHIVRTSWGIGGNVIMVCDECGSSMNELIHCWECGRDFCSASCWPKHDATEEC